MQSMTAKNDAHKIAMQHLYQLKLQRAIDLNVSPAVYFEADRIGTLPRKMLVR